VLGTHLIYFRKVKIQKMQKITIAGAGLVGSLLAIYLAKKGFEVNIFERRADMRKLETDGGRSINLALSHRGWQALDAVDVSEKIKPIAIPMYGRMIHNMDGTKVYQPYGEAEQAIYSVSRAELNRILMDTAESYDKVKMQFDTKCSRINTKENTIELAQKNGETLTLQPDLIMGADGAFSAVRSSLQRTSRFNYAQEYLPHGYKELTIPAGENGSFLIEKNALHIWPRKNFMLIALPNLDGSFTCTLFLAFEGDPSFECLQTEADVKGFFNTYFASAVPIMPTLIADFFKNPTSSLVTIRCNPWSYGHRIGIIGDASHAIVPFYGQGMNSGFEDCYVFNQVLEKYSNENGVNWNVILQEFEEQRIPDANAIADLALRNFVEMRDSVADPKFLLQKKIAKYLHKKFPNFLPLYSLVTFSHVRYSEALALGKKQDAMFAEIMKIEGIETKWQTGELDAHFAELMQKFVLI